MIRDPNITNETQVTSCTEYKIAEVIWKVVPPIFIVLGTVGNVLSIIVLTRKSIRTSTTSLYLTVLAVSDLIALYTGIMRQWVKFLFEVDIRQIGIVSCKIHQWELNTFLNFSAWILIGITMERVICILFPHSAKTTCTKKVAVTFMSLTVVFLILLNSHFIYGMGFYFKYNVNGTDVEQFDCTEKDPEYGGFIHNVWPHIDLFTFCVIPCSFIIVGNFLILFKLIRKRRLVRSGIVPTLYSLHLRRQPSVLSRRSSMTTMLLTLNFVFLFSSLPISVYNVGHIKWETNAKVNNDNCTLALLELWWAVVNVLMYSSNALNFYLYCLSGSRFRQEVRAMLCKRRQWNREWIECLYPLRCIRSMLIKTTESSSAAKDIEHNETISEQPTMRKSNENEIRLDTTGYPSVTTMT